MSPYNVYLYCYKQSIETAQGPIKHMDNHFDPISEYGKGQAQGSIDIAPCSDALGFYTLLRNDSAFIQALNIDTTKSPLWNECSSLDYTKDQRQSYYLYPKLIKNNIKLLKFSGEVPHPILLSLDGLPSPHHRNHVLDQEAADRIQ